MKNNKIVTLVIMVILFLLSYTTYKIINEKNRKIDTNGNLNIYFFNAGKADACIISKDDISIMIDTGEENLSDEILSYLYANNINKLDYLIISHFDKDHVGSASKIIDNIDIDNVLQSNIEKDSIYYNNYIQSIKNKNITPIIIKDNYSFELGDVMFNVNGPNKIYEKNTSNNSSLIVSINYKNNSFIFMGDSQNDRIKDFIGENTQNFDFIKMPYHGNYQKSLDELLKNVNPKYALITSSNEKLEEKKMIDLLKKSNIKYYLTREGEVLISSSGNKIVIKQ